ncbi:MAG: trypsin-like peptidase domain-containing protein [Planctomycetota bacterium]|nr:trypsin-like peptidase domain-containing protein [Planctomycetota bacterium]
MQVKHRLAWRSLRWLFVFYALTVASTAHAELLVFTAPWCKVCRLMDNTTQRMLGEGFAVREVDVDQHADAAKKFQIRGVPTLVMVDGDREIRRFEGPQSFAQLRDWFAQAGQLPQNPLTRPNRARATTQRELIPRQSLGQQVQSGPLSDPPGLSKEATVQRALAASVRLKVEDEAGHSYGSGTLIDVHGQHGLVVTCAHIFRDSQGQGPISADLFLPGKTETVRGQLVRYDLDQDIALVSIPLTAPVVPVPVSLIVQEIQKQQAVFSIGCDRGADPNPIHSQIVDINRYLNAENLLVKGHPVDGRSGGGLFNQKGELIGVCNAADHERDEGLFASLPVIHRILDSAKLSSVYQRSPNASPLAAPSNNLVSNDLPVSKSTAMNGDRGSQLASFSQEVRTSASPPRGQTTQSTESDTEVICIVRSRTNRQQPAEIIVVHEPSPAVLAALRQEGQPQANTTTLR